MNIHMEIKWTLTLHKPYTKINFRWIVEINVKSKIVKIKEENRGEHFHELRVNIKWL